MSNPQRPTVLVLGKISPPYGGTETITEIILRSNELRRHFDVRSLLLWKPRRQEHRGRFGVSNFLINLGNLLRFLYTLAQAHPAIVYMPMAQNLGGFLRDSLFVWLGLCSGAQIVIHFHGSGIAKFWRQQHNVVRQYIRRTLGVAAKVIVLSEGLRTQFAGIVSSDRIEVVYNGLDLAPFEYLAPERRRGRSELNVLFMGNISHAKGAVDVALAIPQVLAKSGQHVKFWFVGAGINIERTVTFIDGLGGGYSQIQAFIQANGLSQYTRFPGELYGDDKLKAFERADIFVLPSYSEGVPMVVLEAMAAGLPLVVTPVGALPEILEYEANCFFVQPGDWNAIADAVNRLARDPELRQKQGKANRVLVRGRFDKSILVKGLTRVWKTCLS